ncbi:MAG: ABC transporter ATP-binding protein [Clostridia bacterium]|nr:ABC transporter ATP-binding protein [Clostridia bacterium]
MNRPAIEIRGLTKRYKDVTAVSSFSLDIGRGEMMALLGVNGAGKSTLIGMLSGVIRPDGGDAWLMGHSIMSDIRGAKRLISVSPQESAVAPRLTVKENLCLAAEIYGMDKKEAVNAAANIIEEFDMRSVQDKHAGKLSGGWQRRLSIAMALVSGPEILFLDEPTLGLDVLARRELWEVIRGLRGKVTILMTTHYLEEAEALSDRIAVMKNGCLVKVGTAAELMEHTGTDKFEEAFIALSMN